MSKYGDKIILDLIESNLKSDIKCYIDNKKINLEEVKTLKKFSDTNYRENEVDVLNVILAVIGIALCITAFVSFLYYF